ncbi:MAG: hypothetical protein AAFO69_02110, partial [Bacteroidota bacterium]
MYNKEDFEAKYAQLEDFKLFEILDNAQNFTPEAVETAQEELRRRNTKPDRIEEYRKQKASDHQEALDRATEPLSLGAKIRFARNAQFRTGIMLRKKNLI